MKKNWKEISLTFDELSSLTGREVQVHGLKGSFVGELYKDPKSNSMWVLSDDKKADNPMSWSHVEYKFAYPILSNVGSKMSHVQKIELAILQEEEDAIRESVKEVTDPIKEQLEVIYRAGLDIEMFKHELTLAEHRRDVAFLKLQGLIDYF